jgi:predicted DNA binding CopG/RHH family protein
MSKTTKSNKPLPVHTTDEAAQEFTDNADLSEYDLSGFQPMTFALEKKDARLEMRISQSELETLKEEAKRRGIPHSRLARAFIEQGLRTLTPTPR